MTGEAMRRWPAYGAALWAAMFAVPHLYWGTGGLVGLDTAVSADLASGRSAAFRVVNWGIASFCLAGALVALAAAKAPARPRRRRPLVWLLWCGFALLALRVLDLAVELGAGFARLGDLSEAARRQFLALAPWFGLFWLPWFVLGAILYGLTAIDLRADGRHPRLRS
jgi:hypothetical protein